jgi:hypothetical protein
MSITHGRARPFGRRTASTAVNSGDWGDDNARRSCFRRPGGSGRSPWQNVGQRDEPSAINRFALLSRTNIGFYAIGPVTVLASSAPAKSISSASRAEISPHCVTIYWLPLAPIFGFVPVSFLLM